ncbi:AEC family transporter [Novispirillum sp. DQ9]|uniref:AEC family transporter n=1 Tax=Novispirillum sp. DQ9 TaxID=3398612 RepID=UPI003C7A24AE
MLDVVALIIPFFGLIAVGAVVGRIRRQPLAELGWLNTFVIYVALPALFFQLLSKTPVERLTQWDFIAVNVGTTFVVLVVSLGVGAFLSRGNLSEATIQALAGAYGNIGYMGPGLALLVFGADAAVPVALIFCFENILHFSFAPAMMAVGGRVGGSRLALAGRVLRQIATHPFIIATALGVGAAFAGLTPPQPIDRLIGYLAQAAAPCALFAMGVTLALRPMKRVPLALAAIVPMKLLVHPALMFAAMTAFGPFDPLWVSTAVLLAALPTATNVFVMAQQYDTWVERASATILVSTLLSVITVSLALYLLRAG